MCQVSAIFQVFFVSFCIGRISYQQLKGLSARKVHLDVKWQNALIKIDLRQS